jgi:hypothetical protein
VRHGPELEENKQGKEIVKFADGLANVARGIVQAGDRVFYQQASKQKYFTLFFVESSGYKATIPLTPGVV